MEWAVAVIGALAALFGALIGATTTYLTQRAQRREQQQQQQLVAAVAGFLYAVDALTSCAHRSTTPDTPNPKDR